MPEQPTKSPERPTQPPQKPHAQSPAAQVPAAKPVATNSKPGRAASRCLPAQQELDILVRARYPIVYVVTWEEERVERSLREIAAARNKNLFVWTITQGIVKSGSESSNSKSGSGNTSDPLAALDAVI